MSRLKYILLFLIYLLINRQIAEAINTDSLKTVLTNSKDTVKMHVLTQLFLAYRDTDPNLAEGYISQGSKLADELGNTKWKAIFAKNYGQFYHRTGKVKEAFRFYTKALVYAKQAQNEEIEASVKINTGALLLDHGIYDKATDYLISALRILDKLPVSKNTLKDRSTCLNNLGYLSTQQKQYSQAKDYLLQSLEIKKKTDDLKGIALIYNNLGQISIEEKKEKEAETNFRTALSYYSKSKVTKGKSLVFNNLGEIFSKRNNYDSALVYFKAALQIDSTLESPADMSTTLLNIGNLYINGKQYDKSLPIIKKALKLAEEVSSLEEQKLAYQLLATIYSAKNDYKSAFDNAKKILSINDSIFNETTTEKITSLQIQYETEKKDQEIQLLQTENELKASNLKIQQNITWGLIGIILFSLIVIYLFFNRLKLKQAAREAQLERNRLDIENKLLRVQMNPHFIFNSLNSIQSYISAHDTYSAELYLAKFAALMRYILQNSTQSYVTLEEEIKILRLYLELEQLRFSNKFDFAIIVADNVDEEFTEIPPMLIQPFVENSIKHGIANKTDGQGHIRIDIKAEKGLLHCQITDNGIGRGKASLLKQNIPGYKSLGMQLTGQRLELLKLQSNIDIEIEITDMRDEKGTALGTKVDLQIPFSEID